MGLFDFFKKKTPQANVPVQPQPPLIDIQSYVAEQLQKKLEARQYSVERSLDGKSLIVNGMLEITTTVLDGNYHPFLIHMMISTMHKEYFPQGIRMTLAGMGEGTEAKVSSAIDNYLSTVFPPIVESLTDTHQPDLELISHRQGKDVVWHTRLGAMAYQGPWTTAAPDNFLYLLLREKLPEKLENKTLNWLKIYISRQPGGEIIGECLLNNILWEEGFGILREFAEAWGQKGEFLAQKQFMMFRRSDVPDT